jgi:DNA-binding CsgD family transcriptional regulator
LCLNDIDWDQQAFSSIFLIINTVKGKVALEDKMDYNNILSPREMEILKQVGEGLTSKESDDILSISIHIVNRYRQNILEKLKVKNSVSAFNEVMDKILNKFSPNHKYAFLK